MKQEDSAEWILRRTRRILAEVGPKAARRFLESRGGSTKWEHAAREIARHTLRTQGSINLRTFPSPHLYQELEYIFEFL